MNLIALDRFCFCHCSSFISSEGSGFSQSWTSLYWVFCHLETRRKRSVEMKSSNGTNGWAGRSGSMKLAKIIVANMENETSSMILTSRKTSSHQQSCGKVLFSVVSVCSHVTITRDALDLPVQGPLAPPPPDMRPHCRGTPSVDGADILWLLSWSGRYTSY